ncbi:MAG: ComEC/Rec2 family competence protein [Clostridia bacterium]
MKRFFNNRPMCFFLVFQILGILVGVSFRELYWVRTLSIAACALFASGFCIFKQNRFAYLPIAFAIGLISICGAYDLYSVKEIHEKSAVIEGTISSEIADMKNGELHKFELCNITVNGQKVKGRATIIAEDLPLARAGDKIKIKGSFNSNEFDVTDSAFISLFHKGNYYDVWAKSIQTVGEGLLPVPDNIRINLKRMLADYTNDTTAEITCALLFSDKYGINYDFYSNIIASGLAHIFAVSGLHIGILAAFINKIAKKLKLKGYIKLAVVMSLLIAYSALCGFPSSVIRAMILCFSFMLADCIGRQSDGLSTLGFAGIIALLFFPTDLFSAGCLMSFIAVLGIIVLYPPILARLKFMPKFVKELVGVSLAVNIMLYPIMAYFFNAFQTLFLFANIAILPILPFIYIFILIISFIVLVIPIFAPLLATFNVVTFPILFVSMCLGNLAISVIDVVSLGLFSAIYYLLIFLFSRYIFCTLKTKYIALYSLSATAVLFLTITMII